MNLFNLPFAHRGLHDGNVKVPENSMQSFKLAVEKGYGIEIDVRLLKDGKVAVFHDGNLKRLVKDKNIAISKLTSKDLEKDEYRLANGEKIPLFEELLEYINGKIVILCELKTFNVFSTRLEKAVHECIKGKEAWVVVQSFSPWAVKWFKKNAPEFYRGQLANKAKGGLKVLYALLNPYRMLKMGMPYFLAYKVDHMPSERIKQACKDFNLKLLAWTVKTDEHLIVAQEYGVDQVIFENVEPSDYVKHELVKSSKVLADND